MNSHELLVTLEILEEVTLEQVSHLQKRSLGDGRWIPRGDAKKDQMRLATWKEWRASYEEIIKDTSLPRAEVSLSEKAVRAVDEVVKLELPFEGSEERYWRLLLVYQDTFERLREVLRPVLNGENDNTRFRRAHAAELRKFSELYHGKSNIFVAINYGNAADIAFIQKILEDVERRNSETVKFHYAKNNLLPSLLENAMLYMMACSAGLVFFTQSNFSDRAVQHNPNVCFELGFMWGLGMGRRCGLVKYRDVQVFADISGLVRLEYNNVTEIEFLINTFLRDKLELDLKS